MPGPGLAPQSDVSTIDTTKLSSSPQVLPKALDEQGRQLIARFLDTTAQVQTFISDHVFVIMDMDATHYSNPDFSVRTWSVGDNIEISIIGIAPETAHLP